MHFYPGMLPGFAVSPTLTKRSRQIPWGVKKIQAHKIWKKVKGRRIRIGVIDTGADYSHPDLQGVLGRGINLIDRHILPHDDNGHGTHVTGIIAANNWVDGIVGVAPEATVFPIKAFNHKGSAFVADIIRGLEWCIRNRMDIVNMSFGMQQRSRRLYDLLNIALRAGIVVVASSGNDGKSHAVDYPAKFKQSISVGATNARPRIATFSNRGAHIDLYAPGNKIESTWIKGQYRELSGTSMATAHVSGTIALLLDYNKNLTPSQIKSILIKTATPFGGKATNKGRELNALAAFNYVTRMRTRKKAKSPRKKTKK